MLRNVRDPVELVAAVRQGDSSERELVIDPVCRMVVDPAHAAGRLTYNATAYYFCTLTCPGAFARDPERFITLSSSTGSWASLRPQSGSAARALRSNADRNQ
jgi:YHS domain-containing protein